MTIETTVKALTALNDGYGVFLKDGVWIVDPWPKAWDEVSAPTAIEALAEACDRMDLPWQQHPVWKVWEALQLTEQVLYTKWVATAQSMAWAHGMVASAEDAVMMQRAYEARKAAFEAAKGGQPK